MFFGFQGTVSLCEGRSESELIQKSGASLGGERLFKYSSGSVGSVTMASRAVTHLGENSLSVTVTHQGSVQRSE